MLQLTQKEISLVAGGIIVYADGIPVDTVKYGINDNVGISLCESMGRFRFCGGISC